MSVQTPILNEIKKFKDYNKSFIFLQPLLQLSVVKPINTYLNIQDIDTYYTLVCLYHKDQKGFEHALKKIKANEHFDFDFYDQDGYYYAVFNLYKIAITYDMLKAGKYSMLEGDYRNILLATKNKVIKYALNAKKYYHDFAEELQIHPIDLLQNNAEIITAPDLISETIALPKKITKQLQKKLN